MADLRTRSIQGAVLDARTDRLINQVLTAGILRGGSDDFRVQPQSTPNMTVRVGSGTAGDIAVVAGSREQGVFLVENREPYYGGGTAEVSIDNGDPTNPRIDGIDLVVLDDEADSSGETLARIVVTEGTPAATPVAPDVPAAALRLATVSVPAGESSAISSGYITDLRVPAASIVGPPNTPWTAFTPSVSGWVLGNGNATMHYQRSGRTVHLRVRVQIGSTTTIGSGGLVLGLPFPAVSGARQYGVGAFIQQGSTTRYDVSCEANGSDLTPLVRTSSSIVSFAGLTAASFTSAMGLTPATFSLLYLSIVYEADV